MVESKVNTDALIDICEIMKKKSNELTRFSDRVNEVCNGLSAETSLRNVVNSLHRKACELDKCAYMMQKLGKALEDIHALYIDYECHIKDI